MTSAPAERGGRRAASTGPVQLSAASAASPLSRPRIAEQQQLDPIAALGQDARGDKAVAAVVARPGDDDDPARRTGWRSRHRVGDRAAGAFHQLDAGVPAGDRQPVGLGHFGGGQQLDHAAARIANGGTLRIRRSVAHNRKRQRH